jgi:hypothetical protein
MRKATDGKARAYEIFLYADGTGAVSEFMVDELRGPVYVGRVFLDGAQVVHIVTALDGVDGITAPTWLAEAAV